MKILILSCDTGEGHNAAGRAVKEAAQMRGHQVEMLDMFLLKGKRTSRAVGGTYVKIVTHVPRLFGFIYHLGTLITSAKHKSPVYYANALMAKRLAAYIDENHFDIVITPHLFPAEAMTYMKKKGMMSIPAIGIGTDYTCIPFWEETNLDAYVIPHEDLVEEYMQRGIPLEKLYPFGIPVSQAFAAPEANAIRHSRLHRETSQDPHPNASLSYIRGFLRVEARTICKLPQDVPIYLVMNGSMGAGKLALFAAQLSLRCKQKEHIIIICGSNERLRKLLSREFYFNKRVHVLGYTNHVAQYMDACDVIFTKPGGLTSTEALVKNTPIVHTAPIPGCETANRDFFTQRHLSVSSKHLTKQVHLGMSLAGNPQLRMEMQEAQRKNAKPDAAMRIIDLAEELANAVQ